MAGTVNETHQENFALSLVRDDLLYRLQRRIGLWHLGQVRGSTSEYAQEMPSSLSAPVSDLDPPDVKDGQRP